MHYAHDREISEGICFTCVTVLFISKLFLGKAPWWFLLSSPLRNSIIIPLELPTFYPGRFRWDNRDTAFSNYCHGHNSATCGSKRNSNSPPVTETTKKIHRSKEEWYRYVVTMDWKLYCCLIRCHITSNLLTNCTTTLFLFFKILVGVTLACRPSIILATGPEWKLVSHQLKQLTAPMLEMWSQTHFYMW